MDEPVVARKCPDFVVNKGHYFGTAWQPDEPPLRTRTSAR